jgi:hypothetical protein
VIEHSPSPVIRSCSRLLPTIPAVRKKIFPVAFLSCWEKASEKARRDFSKIVEGVLSSCKTVKSFFVRIMELLDRAGLPLEIDDQLLAAKSTSKPLTLFFLERLFSKEPRKSEWITLLFELNITMGRNAAAHGLLRHARGLVDDARIAEWSEKLGEWDHALELHRASPKGSNPEGYVSSRLRSYAHLEMWDDIQEMTEEFKKWSLETREDNAKWFAWAYYHKGDTATVKDYLRQFHADQHLSEVLFTGFFFLREREFEKCEEVISRAFALLAKDTNSYVAGDAIRLHRNLHYSQMFIELQEAVQFLQRGIGGGEPDFWTKRLKSFHRDSESWIRMIEIRSLVIERSGKHERVYLKMISALRKERQWNLIDEYFQRYFSESVHPTVAMADAKYLWARERRENAINRLRAAVAFLELQNQPLGQGIQNLAQTEVSRLVGVLGQHAPPQYVIPSDKEELLALYREQPVALDACKEKMFDDLGVDNALEARVYRTLASYLYSGTPHTPETLREVQSYYRRGGERNPHDYKQWLGLAYANARMSKMEVDDRDRYAIEAVSGFLKASIHCPENTLEFLCQLFYFLFRVTDGSLVTDELRNDLLKLPDKAIAQVIPQLTDQIAHPNARIRKIVHRILRLFGCHHFELLFYPLKLYQLGEDTEKAALALHLLDKIAKDHVTPRQHAEVFVDGLLRAAISWFEKWILGLDAASRADHHNDRARADKILSGLFSSFDKPQCDLDHLFIRSNKITIPLYRKLFEDKTPAARSQMWNGFKELFVQLSDRVKRLELILLPKVSEQLSSQRGFAITIPGTYQVGKIVPLLHSIEPALEVLGTQQHPRCVYMKGADGGKVKFLLKGNEDIRVDERVMQFFNLINSLMAASRSTREAGAEIVKYSIIPLAPNAGLITWVTGADTLHHMICEHRSFQKPKVSQSKEFDLLVALTSENSFNTLACIQRLECFAYIAKECPATEIRDIFWRRAANASEWMGQSTAFTVTTALMSIVGYAIGLGDRHPSNIMVQRGTGRVIHIDFGDSFENARTRENFPEKVPFRLTRMIVNALDSGTVEGLFRRSCEDVMRVLREGSASLTALLQIFVHEPLEDRGGNKMAQFKREKVDRVAEKLSGKDEELGEWTGATNELSIDAHVDALIQEAKDPANYLKHYPGWCPFW